MLKGLWLQSTLALLSWAVPTFAAGNVTVETVLDGLKNPSGVAVRPGETADRYEVFVADSGTGRVVKTWNNEAHKSTDAVTGFAEPKLREGPIRVAPIALLFLDANHLVVGSSGASVRVYELTDPAAVLSADQAKQQVALSADDENTERVQHVFALVRTRANERVPDAIILASGNGRSSQLRKVPIRAGMLGEIQPFADSKERTDADQSADVCLAEREYIVAGDAGASTGSRDSRMVFYNPIDGMQSMELGVKLFDVVGLAYSPKTGNLYALDAGRASPDRGGVYRIDDAGEPGNRRCAAVKVAEVAKPTALAFGPDGTLYVTALGKPDASESITGILLKLTGEL